MKHYLYISDAMVESIHERISQSFLERVTGRVTVGLEMIRREVGWGEAPLIKRLAIVSHHVQERCEVGTVDRPREYFRGSLPMRWGPCGETQDRWVYFGARTSRTMLGLAGEARFVLGNVGNSRARNFPSSNIPVISDVLSRFLDADGETRATLERRPDFENDLRALEFAIRGLDGSIQAVEFVARRVLERPRAVEEPRMRLLVGSPLYVALVA
jgi:hypothetical protein